MSISEKRGHEFKRVRKGIREGLERGKGRKKKLFQSNLIKERKRKDPGKIQEDWSMNIQNRRERKAKHYVAHGIWSMHTEQITGKST